MKKMINLLFALLLSLSIISCGGDSGDSGDGSTGGGSQKLPGVNESADTTPINPDKSDVQTGTSSNTGCSDAKLPGCKA